MRKAAFFAGEAAVRVVSRSFHPVSEDLPAERVCTDLAFADDSHLNALMDGAFLVIPATGDSSLNTRICRLARARGIHCNNASGEQGDVLIPAVSRGDGYLLAVSTGGGSPAMARYIRRLLDTLRPDIGAMTRLQVRLRAELKGRVITQSRRREILEEVIEDKQTWEALRAGEEGAWRLVEGRWLHE